MIQFTLDKLYNKAKEEVIKDLIKANAVYETFEGDFDACGIKEYDKLPRKAKDYIKAIEDFIGVPVSIIGTGADREDMIVRN